MGFTISALKVNVMPLNSNDKHATQKKQKQSQSVAENRFSLLFFLLRLLLSSGIKKRVLPKTNWHKISGK